MIKVTWTINEEQLDKLVKKLRKAADEERELAERKYNNEFVFEALGVARGIEWVLQGLYETADCTFNVVDEGVQA